MDTERHYSTIFIDSAYRNNSADNTSSFVYTLRTNYTGIRRIQLRKVTIPHSWYGVTSNNNTFTVASNTVTIPPGNYNISSFATAVTTAITASGSAGWTTAISGTNYLLTFTPPGSTTLVIGTTAGKLLGFTPATYTGTGPFTGTYAVNIGGPAVIYIQSNELASSVGKSIWNSTISSIIAGVGVDAYAGDFIVEWVKTYFDYQSSDVYRGGKTMRDIDFRLVDETNTLVDLNGLDWKLELRVWSNNVDK